MVIYYSGKITKQNSTRHWIRFFYFDEMGVKQDILEQKIPFHHDIDAGHNLKNIVPLYYENGYIHQLRSGKYGKKERTVKFPVKKDIKNILKKFGRIEILHISNLKINQ